MKVFLFALFLLAHGWGVAGAAVDFAGLSVTRVAQVKALAMDEEFQEQTVCVEGIVTWADPEVGKFFFVQEAERRGQERVGIKVTYEGESGPAPGEKVKVKGTATRGDFMPVVERAEWEVTGKPGLPVAPEATGGGLLNGAWDAEYIEMEGWIRAAEMVDGGKTMTGTLDSESSRVTFRIGKVKTLDADRLIGAKLRFRGVANPVKSRATIRQTADVQLLVLSEDDIFIWQQSEVAPWEAPVLALREAFQYRLGQNRSERLHVRGKVMVVTDGVAWLHDGDSGMALRGPNVAKVKKGEQVDVVGFRDIENSLPLLSFVTVHADAGPPLEVKVKENVPIESLQSGEYHADYVAVSGKLLDRIDTPVGTQGTRTVLALQSNRGIFTAEIVDAAGVPVLENGCTLRLEGICKAETDLDGDATGFKMLLPDAKSLRVTESAPFFTVGRLLALLSLALGILFLAALTAALLARRNVSLLAQMRERRAIAAERNRLARDLHDTLEQGLTGIHLQLHAIGPSEEEAAPETQDKLVFIRQMVQQCHAELRRSIWDLRAEALEHFDLGDALQRAGQSLFLGSGTRVEVKQPPGGIRIPALVADNLLRIGQEAMTNVLKHAKASVLRVELSEENGNVVLVVSDNGTGLARAAGRSERNGHFGLVGMEERAERIGAKLSIASKPGEGTSIRVEVPLSTPRADG